MAFIGYKHDISFTGRVWDYDFGIIGPTYNMKTSFLDLNSVNYTESINDESKYSNYVLYNRNFTDQYNDVWLCVGSPERNVYGFRKTGSSEVISLYIRNLIDTVTSVNKSDEYVKVNKDWLEKQLVSMADTIRDVNNVSNELSFPKGYNEQLFIIKDLIDIVKDEVIDGVDSISDAVKALLIKCERSLDYDEALDGDRLFAVNFRSSRLKFIDDTKTAYDKGGVTEDTRGEEVLPVKNIWRKNISSNVDSIKVDTLIVDDGDTDSTDSRIGAYIPEYLLENKTYTYEFEYTRNFEKRHKVYFGCGTFVDSNTFQLVTNGGCDANLPLLGIELNYASGYIDYKLYRQSSGFVNNVNLFNRKTLKYDDFVSTGKNYNHTVVGTFYSNHDNYSGELPAKISFGVTSIEPTVDSSIFIGRHLRFQFPGGSFGGEINRISGNIAYVDDGLYYDEIGESLPKEGSMSFTFTYTNTVTNAKEFKTKLRIVLSGRNSITKTLYNNYGITLPNGVDGSKIYRWTGSLVPVDFTVYQINGAHELKIASGTFLQPENIGLIIGVGNYENPTTSDFYGISNLVIYKGGREKLDIDLQAFVVDDTCYYLSEYIDWTSFVEKNASKGFVIRGPDIVNTNKEGWFVRELPTGSFATSTTSPNNAAKYTYQRQQYIMIDGKGYNMMFGMTWAQLVSRYSSCGLAVSGSIPTLNGAYLLDSNGNYVDASISPTSGAIFTTE